MKKPQWPIETIRNRKESGIILTRENDVDARNLVDIFIGEANKYYKSKAVPFGVVCVAAEVFIMTALRRVPPNWQSRGIIKYHIMALDNLKDTWNPPH